MHAFIPYDFAVLAVIFILETILSWSWVAPYFRHGIPIFSKTVPFCVLTSSTAISEQLSRELQRGFWRSQEFHPISEDAVAFREKAFEFRIMFSYTPIMHGLIAMSPLERIIVVKGFLNWFFIAFSVLAVPMAVGTTPIFSD